MTFFDEFMKDNFDGNNLDERPNLIDNQTLNFRSNNRRNGKNTNNKEKEKEEEETKEPRIPFDPRPLKFAKPIDKKDGCSFDFIEPKDIKSYLPKNIRDELFDSSCDELEYDTEEEEEEEEEEERKKQKEYEDEDEDEKNKYNQKKKKKVDNNFETQSNYSSSSTDLFGEKDEISINTKSNKEGSWTINTISETQEHSIFNEDGKDSGLDRSSQNSEDIIGNLPISGDLKKIQELREQRKNFDSFNNKKKRKKTKKKYCFGCMWQDPHNISINGDAVSKMMFTMNKLHGQIRTIELAKIIHLMFMKNIYFPIKQEIQNRILDFDDDDEEKYNMNKKKIPIWRTYQIYDHIKTHVKDPRFFILNSIEDFEEDSEILKAMSYTYTRDVYGNEHPSFDEKAIKLKLDINRRLMELYSKNPKQMNFFNDKIPVDFNQIGSSLNLHKNFRLKK